MKYNSEFPTLSTVAKIMRIVGILAMIFAILALLEVAGGAIFRGAIFIKGYRWDFAKIIIDMGVFAAGLLLEAFGEIIGVLFAIELNTRKYASSAQAEIAASRVSSPAPKNPNHPQAAIGKDG